MTLYLKVICKSQSTCGGISKQKSISYYSAVNNIRNDINVMRNSSIFENISRSIPADWYQKNIYAEAGLLIISNYPLNAQMPASLMKLNI